MAERADPTPPPERLFTWVDIDEHLALLASKGEWPSWLLAADSWWDSLELVVAPDTEVRQVQEWLDHAFGAGSTELRSDQLLLGLDDPRVREFTGIPVELLEGTEGGAKARRLPLLREKHITRELADPFDHPPRGGFPGNIEIVAFHSFKGGVGRTVHAVALADAVAQRGGNVLLVDADLEAPGITWMHRAQGGQLDFAYEDLLALLQSGEDGDCSAAVDIAAAYLPNQQVGHHPGGGRLTLIPATRREVLAPPRIEPADLLTPDRSRYFLTEALAALATRAGADTVVVDLRAGASELSAPVLLDPRVQRVFVTTLSHQSLSGTETLIRQLGSKAPSVQGTDPPSSVIITQYRQDVHASQAQAASGQLGAALRSALDSPEEDQGSNSDTEVDTDILSQPVLSPFREEMLALPPAWDDVLRVLDGVSSALESIIPTPISAPAETHNEAEPPEKVDHGSLRRLLAQTADAFKYAEDKGLASSSGFLVTDPLRRLLGDHRTEPPLSLVVGAKGAGKTFLYSKACAAKTWSHFAELSTVDGVKENLPVVPVLESDNLNYDELAPQDLRNAFAAEHGDATAGPESVQQIRDRLKRGLATLDQNDELGWRQLWLECLAAAVGIAVDEESGAEAALVELGKRAQAVFVMDGLEDLLQTLDNAAKRTALRVLLTDVLTWLRSLRGRPFGLVVFVRSDLVTGAVQQNSAQLLSRYERYALRWSHEEALRLALWVTAYAGAHPDQGTALSRIQEMSYDELVETLIPVWGWKMGSERSKEARTHLWVPAALGDFNNQVQARDVVVFLGEAAQLSIPSTSWDDRLLAPTAMRKALYKCGELKIDSVAQEAPEVGKLLEKLQRSPVNVPFVLDEVPLSAEEAEFLVESGVFARGKDGRYRVTEIYRHGLGFGSERRAKVLGRR